MPIKQWLKKAFKFIEIIKLEMFSSCSSRNLEENVEGVLVFKLITLCNRVTLLIIVVFIFSSLLISFRKSDKWNVTVNQFASVNCIATFIEMVAAQFWCSIRLERLLMDIRNKDRTLRERSIGKNVSSEPQCIEHELCWALKNGGWTL